MRTLLSLIIPLIIITSATAKSLLDTIPQQKRPGYHSNEIEDFTAANPVEGIPIMQAPIANSKGGAHTSLPIKLPPARQGMTPVLGLEYNSENDNSWTGLGWDVSISKITIDTRWGVPRYDATKESETYLLDGAQLFPIFHRAVEYDREVNRQFHQRIEGSFHQIIRHGNSPKNYFWEITDKQGVVNYYGGMPESGLNEDAILKDEFGNIAHWQLVRTQDPNGNLIEYEYEIVKDKGLPNGTIDGSEIYPLAIYYNGHLKTRGDFSVHFKTDRQLGESKRKDIEINARLGFKRVSTDRLREIEVRYKEQTIRTYELNYIEGAFYKTLLSAVRELDSEGQLFYEYEFDYYKDVLQGNQYQPYEAVSNWEVPKDNISADFIISTRSFDGDTDFFSDEATVLGSSASSGRTIGGSLTFGPFNPFDPLAYISKKNTIGGHYSNTKTEGEGISALIDINGDGLPDKVYRKNDRLYYRSNLFNTTNPQEKFGEERPIIGIKQFSQFTATANAGGPEVNPPIGFIGASFETAKTNVTTYFADFNGDELMDVCLGGTVYFNHINSEGNPEFTMSSADTPSPIQIGAPIDAGAIEVDTAEQEQLISQFPLHDVVRMWRAPFAGQISITGAVQLIESEEEEATRYLKEDGVSVAIQRNGIELWRQRIEGDDFVAYEPQNVQNINVQKGDQIYFRVQSIFDGAYDQVQWIPEITYQQEAASKDPNRLENYTFNAASDYLLASCQIVEIALEGVINIEGTFEKPVTSDDLIVEILMMEEGNTTPLLSDSLNWDTTLTMTTNLTDLEVRNGQAIVFRVSSNTQIDWRSLNWNPRLYYTDSDSTIVTGPNGEPLVSVCPAVDYIMFNDVISPSIPWFAEIEDTINVVPQLPENNTWEGEMTFSVKSNNRLIAKQNLSVQNGEILDSVGLSITTQVNDTLYFELHTTTRQNIGALEGAQTVISNNNEAQFAPLGIHTKIQEEDLIFGTLYRSWGQFIYNGNRARANLPINEAELVIEEMMVDTNIINDPDLDPNDLEPMSPDDQKFLLMVADPKTKSWIGTDDLTYITRNQISSSRLGEDDLAPPVFQSNGDGLSAPPIQTESKINSIAGGVVIGGGGALNTTKTLLELTDINGDRFPDILFPNDIQYTNTRGGLDTTIAHNLGAHTAKSEAIGASLGGGFPSSNTSNSGTTSGAGSNKRNSRRKSRSGKAINNSGGAVNAAEISAGFSGSYNRDNDRTEHTFLDINGDGLEDKVYKNGDVRLGLGYRFAAVENWGFEGIRGGLSEDVGGGLGLSLFNGSIEGGVSVAKSFNHSKFGLQDVNDDNLVDLITSENPLIVRINTGNGFGEEIRWTGTDKLDEGDAVGESVNAAITFCIPIFVVRTCINPSSSIFRGVGKQKSMINDVNGDGYPDYLTSNGENQLEVRASTIGRTNLLKSIKNPIGGTITLDYKIEGNTYGLPYSIWALSSIAVDDGLVGDGVDVSKTKITYGNGHYDRHERTFLGFEEVKVHHLDEKDAIYRTIVNQFDIKNIYRNGLLKNQDILDVEGNLYKSFVYQNQLKDVVSGADFIPSQENSDNAMAFPALIEKKTIYYEGSDSLSMQTSMLYIYDRFGNVVEERDLGNGSNMDILTTEYTYHDDSLKYFKSYLKEVKKTIHSGLRQHSKYEIDDRGNITRLSHLLEDGQSANYDMQYDEYGNVLQVLRPENHVGERLQYDYVIEDELHQYPITENDNYGYITHRKYDLWYGHEIQEIGINQDTSTQIYDHRGRLWLVRYAMEHRDNQPYSIKMEYASDAEIPYAVAHYFDPEQEGDIDIYSFSDGLGRTVQLKKEFDLFKGKSSPNEVKMIVSGTEIFDAFGRVIEEYHPIEETLGRETRFNEGLDNIPPLTTTYDVLDRPVQMIERDGGVALYQYKIATTNNGITSLVTNLRNANGNTGDEFYDIRGRLIASRKDSPDGDIWKYYQYNGLSELETVTDQNGNVIRYEYDWLGRRTKVHYPDAGITELEYDLTGNLRHRITSNIREVISKDGSIRYSYDKERLVQIDYPKYFQNKVQIHYGSPTDSLNRAGRVWLLEDAAGGREFSYDINGEIIKTIRTTMVNRSNVFTFVWENEFDTWGRIQQMIYPDGEVVTFDYDRGGKLLSMTGEKLGTTYPIVQQLGYDKFEDRVFMQYGNGSVTSYQYEDGKGRLEKVNTVHPKGNSLLSYDYQYDFLDNLIGAKGQAMIDSKMNTAQFDYAYNYDPVNRLSGAMGDFQSPNGQEDYQSSITYDVLDNLTQKIQENFQDNAPLEAESYQLDYSYESENQPHRATQIGNIQNQYDANGNAKFTTKEDSLTFTQNLWDEENRLIANATDGYVSYYTYDAFGERTVKSHGGLQGIFINGAAAGYLNHRANFAAYLSPYFTYSKDEFTKHYFIEDERILTKVGTGNFNTNLFTGQVITAGGLDYRSRIQQYEFSILDYYESLGIPPGPPTIPGYYAQPEINATSLPNATNQNPYTAPPTDWPNLLGPPDPNGPPGPPVWFEPEDNSSVGGGYGFEGFAQFYEYEQIFYSYNLFGDVELTTDNEGDVRQYNNYYAQGELWKELQDEVSLEFAPYFFRGLELDRETGMYYRGDRYFHPRTGFWLSLDPQTQDFGDLTYDTRPEGFSFYQYAGTFAEEEENIDTEILNIERPDLIVDGTVTISDISEIKLSDIKDYKENQAEIKKRKRQFELKPNDPKSEALLQKLYADLEAYDNQKKKNRQFQLKPNDPKSRKAIRSVRRKIRFREFKERFRKEVSKGKEKVRVK